MTLDTSSKRERLVKALKEGFTLKSSHRFGRPPVRSEVGEDRRLVLVQGSSGLLRSRGVRRTTKRGSVAVEAKLSL